MSGLQELLALQIFYCRVLYFDAVLLLLALCSCEDICDCCRQDVVGQILVMHRQRCIALHHKDLRWCASWGVCVCVCVGEGGGVFRG